MSRERFLFRPNLQKEAHRKAWEALQAVPEGQRSAFLVQVILQSLQADLLRKIIREELSAAKFHPEPPEETIPSGMLDFLDSLQKEN